MRISLQNWMRRMLAASATRDRRRARRLREFHPRFEALETRLALSAATQPLALVKDPTYVVNTLADVVNPDDGKLSLREAVALANANPGSTIVLGKIGTYKLTNWQADDDGNTDLDITADMTITSLLGLPGYYRIDGNRTDRVMEIGGAVAESDGCGPNVAIKNVTIQNGLVDGDGAGIDMESNGGSLTLFDVVVKSNTASGMGGGVFVAADNTVKLGDTTFKNNLAGDNGGGLAAFGPSLTITNSVFNANKSGGSGGGVYFEDGTENLTSTLTVTGTSFLRNRASFFGGGLCAIVSGAAVPAEAGTLQVEKTATMTVARSTFNGNSCGYDGGGVAVGTRSYEYDVNASADGIVPITLAVTGSTFVGNAAADGGGIACWDVQSAAIDRSVFTRNSANWDGGAVAVWDYDLTDASLGIRNSTFTRNCGDYGGGVYCEYVNSVSIDHSTFTRNQATGDYGGGLAVYDWYYSGLVAPTVNVTDSTFSANFAYMGGGIAVAGNASLTIDGSTIVGNRTQYGGGGVAFWGYSYDDQTGTALTITDSVISRNTGGGNGYGGGVFVWEESVMATVTITGTTVSNNFVGGRGGGISLVDDYAYSTLTATLSGDTITGNTAAGSTDVNGDGGGVYIETSPGQGGGVVDKSDDFGGVSIYQCTIANNRATQDGGGLYLNVPYGPSGTASITASTFSGNQAARNGGGAFFTGDGDMTLVNDTFSGNAAAVNGGGIYVDSGVYDSLHLIYVTIALNKAHFGGGIYNEGTVYVQNTIIAKNTVVGPPENGPDACGYFYDDGNNLIGISDGSDGFTVSTLVGTADSPIDPKLGKLKNNGGPTKTMALLKGSPAIAAAFAIPDLTTDQRGVARDPEAPSIGAYEF